MLRETRDYCHRLFWCIEMVWVDQVCKLKLIRLKRILWCKLSENFLKTTTLRSCIVWWTKEYLTDLLRTVILAIWILLQVLVLTQAWLRVWEMLTLISSWFLTRQQWQQLSQCTTWWSTTTQAWRKKTLRHSPIIYATAMSILQGASKCLLHACMLIR